MKVKDFDGYDSTFAKRFRDLIDERNDTQSNISKTLDISRQTVSMYFNGQTIPTADKLRQLAEYFHVSSDYLIGLTDEKSMDIEKQAIFKFTGLHEDSANNIFEMKRHFDIDKVEAIIDLIFSPKSSFSFEHILKFMFAYHNGTNEIELHLIPHLCSDIEFCEEKNMPVSYEGFAAKMNDKLSKLEDDIYLCLFKATDDFRKFLDECAASELETYHNANDYKKAKEECLAKMEIIKERALAYTDGKEDQPIPKEKWREIINGNSN